MIRSMINKKKFNVFPEDWREYMKIIFCLVSDKRVIGLIKEKIHVTICFRKQKVRKMILKIPRDLIVDFGEGQLDKNNRLF